MKMELPVSSGTSALKTQTPGDYPEDTVVYILFVRINNLHAFSTLPSSFLLYDFGLMNLVVWVCHSRCVLASFVSVTETNMFDIMSDFPFYCEVEGLQVILMLCVCNLRLVKNFFFVHRRFSVGCETTENSDSNTVRLI